MADWQELAAAALSGSALREGVIWFKEWRTKKSQQKGILDKGKMYRIFSDLIEYKGVQLCLTARAHNGGKRLSAFTPQFITAEDGLGSEPFDINVLIEDIQALRLDAQFVEVLNQLVKTNQSILAVATMPPCRLRDLCISHKISYLEAYPLGFKNESFYFYLLGTSNPTDHFEDVIVRASISTFRDRLEFLWNQAKR